MPLEQYATLKFDDLNEVFNELEYWLAQEYGENQ